MSRRKQQNDNGSLELLLDTICNTFGGILFISLLVVILLNTTSEKIATSQPQEMTQLELVESEIKREGLASELERLQLAVGQLDVNSDAIVTPEIVDLANRLHIAEKSKSNAIAENSQVQGQLNQTQIAINETISTSQSREQQLEAAKKLAAALEERLEQSIAQRSGEAVIPKLSNVTLSPIIYVLQNGKLYGPWSQSNDLKGTDLADGRTQVDVVPNRGTVIDPQGDTAAFKQQFANFASPTRHVVGICIWPDSFDQWSVVRRCLSELNLKYDLFPLEENESLFLGEGSGSSSAQGG